MNAKSKLKMWKLALTEGRNEATKIGLGEKFENWTPLHLWIYGVGIGAGFVMGIFLIDFIWLLSMAKYFLQ